MLVTKITYLCAAEGMEPSFQCYPISLLSLITSLFFSGFSDV